MYHLYLFPRFWKSYEMHYGGSKVVDAFLTVVRHYLTPPPTSTNTERLFSYGGIAMDDRRARLNPDKLDKILFLRENILLTNFKLEWD